MKGYFPRLIQQTGITFGPIGNTRHSTLEHSPVRHERRDAVNPIHGNEEKPIETQADQTNRNIHEGVREDPESLATVLENENIQQPLEERFEIKITGEPQNHASEREEQKHQKREPEGQKLVVFDKDIQSSLKRVEPHHEIKADDLLGREEIVEIDTVSRDYAQQSDTHAATTNQEHKKAPGFTPEVKPEEQISQVQSRQTYIKEVRDWVAGIPVVNDEETKGKDITMTQVTEKKGLSAMDEWKKLTASYPRPMASQQREEPEVHDFHLSIGTISLTIEGPQKEVQSKQPPQEIRGERKSGRKSEASRLSRHYIRIR